MLPLVFAHYFSRPLLTGLLAAVGAACPSPLLWIPSVGVALILAVTIFRSSRAGGAGDDGSIQRLRLLVRWTRIISEATEITTLLDLACRTLVEGGGYRAAWIALGSDEKHPTLSAHHGIEDDLIEELGQPDLRTEPAATAWHRGEPVVVQDFHAENQRETAWSPPPEIRSAVAVPLHLGGKRRGLLSVYSEHPNRFNEDQVVWLTDLAGGLAGGVIRLDLSEEVAEARHQVEQLEGRYEDVVQNLIAGIVIQDADLNFEYVNPAAAEMLGYQREELLGCHWTLIVPEDQRPIVRQADERRAEGFSDQYELQLERKDGERITVLVSGRPRMVDGQSTGAVVVFTDISERVKAERQMRLHASALDAAANAILITDRKGTIEWVNPAWTDLTGFTYEEAVGENPRILKSGVQDDEFYADLWRTITAGDVWQGEVINRRKDGSLYSEEETITPLIDSGGEVTHFIGVKRDISQQKRDQERIQRQLSRLNALREIDLAINASLDPHVTFNVLLTQVTDQLEIDAADILVFDRHTQTLTHSSGRGFRTEALVHTRLKVGEGLAGEAALARKTIIVPDLSATDHSLSQAPLLAQEEFVTYYAVPLLAKGIVQGVLEIFHRERLDPDQEWLDFLDALAGQAAIAIDNAMLFAELNRTNVDLVRAYDTTLEGWARALELRDIETEGHSQRVTQMALRLARQMGVEGEDLLHLRRGALLHDIGKMGIPDSILHNPGELSDQEWEVMRKHPRYAYELLGATEYLRPALDIPYCHHEKWDGSGYPRGLKGEETPLAARIFAVVDVWDALRSDRPYREAWSDEAALQYLERERGRHFDAKVVDTFLGMLRQQ